MHDVFHGFVEQLTDSPDKVDLCNVLAETASSLDLPSFAYLLPSTRLGRAANLISTYPQPWTSRYLHRRYEEVDPVIHQARGRQDTFSWDADGGELELSTVQQALMDEATQFGIRRGFTIPIHDDGSAFVAVATPSAGIGADLLVPGGGEAKWRSSGLGR